jgi:putative sigma-54 modulation protein
MNLIIKAHNFEITPSIEQHVQNKFKKITNHFDHLIDAKFILSLEKIDHIAQITIHLPRADIHAESSDENMYHAIEIAIQKLDRQVIKYKEKNSNHHQADGSIKNKLE